MSIFKIRDKENNVVGDVEYDLITRPNIFHIEELTICGKIIEVTR